MLSKKCVNNAILTAIITQFEGMLCEPWFITSWQYSYYFEVLYDKRLPNKFQFGFMVFLKSGQLHVMLVHCDDKFTHPQPNLFVGINDPNCFQLCVDHINHIKDIVLADMYN